MRLSLSIQLSLNVASKPLNINGMDQSYIASVAQSTRRQKERERVDLGIRLLDAGLIKEKASAYWAEVLSEIEQFVAGYNRELADEPSLHMTLTKGPHHQIELRSEAYPHAQATVVFNVPAQHVEFSLQNVYIGSESTSRPRPLPMTINPYTNTLVVENKDPHGLAVKIINHIAYRAVN